MPAAAVAVVAATTAKRQTDGHTIRQLKVDSFTHIYTIYYACKGNQGSRSTLPYDRKKEGKEKTMRK